jgi:hypothetical protein
MTYTLYYVRNGERGAHPCRSLKDAVWEAWMLIENGEGDPDYVADAQGTVVLDREALLQQVAEKDER